MLSNDHKDMLASFGLEEESNFPTAAFVPPAKGNNDNMVGKLSYCNNNLQ